MEAGSIGRFQGHKGAVWRWTSTRMLARRPPGGGLLHQGVVWDVLSGEEKLTLQHKHIPIVKSAALATGAVVTIRFPGSLVIFCGNK